MLHTIPTALLALLACTDKTDDTAVDPAPEDTEVAPATQDTDTDPPEDSAQDTDSGTASDCDDGVDNDNDGWIDDADPDCATGDTEIGYGSTECNDGVDNDGDGDVDGDDPGCDDAYDDSEGALPADADGDGFESSMDCDDNDASAYPGAPELCDGTQNDCDAKAWTSDDEATTVTRFDAAGAFAEDLTSAFAAGTSNAPLAYTLPADGTVSICAGTWYVTLQSVPKADVAVVGLPSSSEVVLAGGNVEGHALLEVVDATVTMSGVTLAGGGGVGDCLYGSACGGAVYAEGKSATYVGLDDVRMVSSYVWYGPAVYATGSVEVAITASEVTANSGYVNGAFYLLDGALLTMDDTYVHGNYAVNYGSAAILDGADLVCTGAKKVDAGFHDNDVTYPGRGQAVSLDNGATLVSDVCDWGEGSQTNGYYDIQAGGSFYDYGDDETFTCDDSGCF